MPKTFSQQAQLPTLPLPEVEDTCRRYLRSVEALLVGSPDHAGRVGGATTSDASWQRTQAAVAAFVTSPLAQTLQKRLRQHKQRVDREESVAKRGEKALADPSPRTGAGRSWFSDLWYAKAYLEYREPCALLVNWTMGCDNHPICGQPVFRTNAAGTRTNGVCPVRRATWVIRHATEYRDMIWAGQVPVEYGKGANKKIEYFCMDQYRRIFSVTRRPAAGCDEIITYDKAASSHCIVLCNDHYWKVECYGKDSKVVDANVLFTQLQHIVAQSGAMPLSASASTSLSPSPLPVGALTSEHRDRWVEARALLVQADRHNSAILQDIESAMFCISLDVDVYPESITELCKYGHESVRGGCQRWFDKSVSFGITGNGQMICNGEHAPSDAPVPGALVDHVLARESIGEYMSLRTVDPRKNGVLLGIKELKWRMGKDPQVRNALEQRISDAVLRFGALCRKQDIFVLLFTTFGKNTLKSFRVSPDACVQMAYQLTYYRLHKRVVATYETGGTRRFLYGRTECVRSASCESRDFVQACVDTRISRRQVALLLKKAIVKHSTTTKEALYGKGVDRHLLALRCVLENDEVMPDIFTDPAYALSTDFVMSTSNISMGKRWLGGFAPVTLHGYGLGYWIGSTKIRVSITCNKPSSQTVRAATFAHALSESLIEVRDLLICLADAARL